MDDPGGASQVDSMVVIWFFVPVTSQQSTVAKGITMAPKRRRRASRRKGAKKGGTAPGERSRWSLHVYMGLQKSWSVICVRIVECQVA